MSLLNFVTHPIDTIENTGRGIINFVEHPINTTETFFNDEKTKVTNFVEHPLSSVENGFTNIANEIKAIPNEIKSGFQATEEFFDNVVKEGEAVGKIVYNDVKWVGNEVEIIAEDVFDGAKALYRIGNKTVKFVENNYQAIMFVVASYLAARYVNEVKTAVN